MDLHCSPFFLCLLVVSLIQNCFCEIPRQPVRFQSTRPNLKRESAQNVLKTQNYCFKWLELHAENNKCWEIEVQISNKCHNNPYDTIYVPCDLNINTNSYIGYFVLRIWDYLYSVDGKEYYYMTSDGSCLKKTYKRSKASRGDAVDSTETPMSKAQCDVIKSKVSREAGVLDENVKKMTWTGAGASIPKDLTGVAGPSAPQGKIERWVIGSVVGTIKHLPNCLKRQYEHFCDELVRIPTT